MTKKRRGDESVIPAKLEVVVDGQLLKDEVKKQVEAAVVSQLWFVDAKRISELTCLSPRFLEEHVFSDIRMRTIMIQKNRKRLWKSDLALETISEIFSEW